MEKRRVYQVAKEKKLSSDALITMLKSMGHEVKSHMSVVTEEMAAAIASKIEAEKKTSIEEVQRQKVQEETRKKARTRAIREAATDKAKEESSRPRGESVPRVRTNLPVGRDR
ncbi:MAG: translation initiation factor IF-2 N-terminal domain-containing protein, partial [Proteobacteria bacterium]|nr:translation initiation factor IF-2 N-terminal domain-containing protein [Pseudomonadota bacterium]